MPVNLVSRLANGMGNAQAKTMKAKRNRFRQQQRQRADEDDGSEQSNNQQQQQQNEDTISLNVELEEMKKLARNKPEAFLLNNLVMSIQLFSNYEKEMERAKSKLEASVDELNEKLLPEKSVLMPDALREHFAGRVRFTSNCKSDKDDQSVEPIRPIRIYAIYENVLVSELDETRHYSNPDELTVRYNFVLKKADHEGYVRLEQRQLPPRKSGPGSDNTDLSSIAENDNSENESVYGPITNRNGLLDRTASSSVPNLFHEDEDEYCNGEQVSEFNREARNSWSRTNNDARNSLMRQHQQKAQSHRFTGRNSASSSSSGYTTTIYGQDSDSDSSTPSRNLRDASDIPQRCMKRVTYTHDGRIYNPRREPKPLNRQQRRIRDAKLARNYDVVYVNGYRLAKHFYEVFRDQLGEFMGFDESTLKNSKRCDATIRLEKIFYETGERQASYIKIEPYEVMPCLSSPWPKWARGWLNRQRSSWPSYDDLMQVEKFGCCLVPETSRPMTTSTEEKSHPLWKLDWSLSFPAAERYLEARLSPSQASVLTLTIMLHKTFIRALGSSLGLSTAHIRNAVFWISEKCPEWSELRMGECMLKLMEFLHNRIQQRSMPDYFMEERNLFSNVNTDDLLYAQKQLKRIIENPVMYVLHAMEKIQYEHDDYPRLNYGELLRLLTLNQLLLINPHLEEFSGMPGADPDDNNNNNNSSSSGSNNLYIYGRREAEKKFWTEVKQNNQQYMQTRKRSVRPVINPRRAHDSVIDIQESCEELTPARLTRVVEFFAKHFIKMAHCCHDLGAKRSKHAYLDQTKLLAELLLEYQDCRDTAHRFLQEVQELRDSKSLDLPDASRAPVTPKRNSIPPLVLRRQVSYSESTDELETKDELDDKN